uniref:Uncharacterized protein n=1 Tax=Ananas comosus var. bracteatus TaxID=296719 RepID=A0A6V7PTD4_ANACO|nr:unnamed protein product [Ananas comosus var. bracteatus]
MAEKMSMKEQAKPSPSPPPPSTPPPSTKRRRWAAARRGSARSGSAAAQYAAAAAAAAPPRCLGRRPPRPLPNRVQGEGPHAHHELPDHRQLRPRPQQPPAQPRVGERDAHGRHLHQEPERGVVPVRQQRDGVLLRGGDGRGGVRARGPGRRRPHRAHERDGGRARRPARLAPRRRQHHPLRRRPQPHHPHRHRRRVSVLGIYKRHIKIAMNCSVVLQVSLTSANTTSTTCDGNVH